MSHFKREYETLIDPDVPFVPKAADREDNVISQIRGLLYGLSIDQLKKLSSLIQQQINIASKQKNGGQTAEVVEKPPV